MILKNYMEDAVSHALDELLEKETKACGCGRCRMDVMALALNQLAPRYVVTDKGHVYTRVAEMAQQFGATLTVVLSRAMQKVKENPRH